MTKPKMKYLVVVNAGRRVRPDVDKNAIVRTRYDKGARRIARRAAINTSRGIGQRILIAQRDRAEATASTSNGHAARRLMAKELEHRRRGKSQANTPGVPPR